MIKVGNTWLPDGDTYFPSFFEKDDVFERHNLNTALKFVKKWDVAVDGGAHVGSWTRELCNHFAKVIAFEPQPDNFRCLKANAPQAECRQMGLGKEIATYSLAAGSNTGCWHLTAGDDIAVIPLPDYGALDFLKLDVEGFEADVLEGCKDQLIRYKPVVVIEEKNLPHKPLDYAARRLLEGLGAKEKAKAGRDVVFAWD